MIENKKIPSGNMKFQAQQTRFCPQGILILPPPLSPVSPNRNLCGIGNYQSAIFPRHKSRPHLDTKLVRKYQKPVRGKAGYRKLFSYLSIKNFALAITKIAFLSYS